jgi:hypothetical protein
VDVAVEPAAGVVALSGGVDRAEWLPAASNASTAYE